RQRWLLRRREEAQRDLPDGHARADARHPRRDGLGPRHRRAEDRLRGRQRAAQPRALDDRHHALPAPPRSHRPRRRPRPLPGPHRRVGWQGAGAQARGRGLRRREEGSGCRMNAPAKLGPLALLDAAPSGGPAFIEALRQRGRDAVAGSGLPGKRDEAWRFTSVLALTKVPFALAPTQAADVTSDAHVTLVDGVPHIAGQLPAGIEVTPLHAALAAAPADIESTLGSLGGTDFFAGLNAATLSDGVVVRIRRE